METPASSEGLNPQLRWRKGLSHRVQVFESVSHPVSSLNEKKFKHIETN